MKKTRTTRSVELTIEQTELTAVRTGREQLSAWCDGCGRPTRFVTAEEAARLTNTPIRAIFRRIEAAEVHFLETHEGGVQICLESLGHAG